MCKVKVSELTNDEIEYKLAENNTEISYLTTYIKRYKQAKKNIEILKKEVKIRKNIEVKSENADDINNNTQCISIKDIQFLLIMYAGYIEDKGGDYWQDKEFKKIADKYNFNKENLYKGFEHLTC
mgnify:CR=1 FL=1